MALNFNTAPDAQQHPSSINLVSCFITKPNGLLATKVSLNPSLILGFDLREDLYSPFLGGMITISDSINFVSNYPITGGEIISFEIETSYLENGTVSWELMVNNIETRILPDPKKQVYILKLVSKELAVNETCRVKRKIKGSYDEVITELVQKDLKSDKKVFTETSKNKTVKIPGSSDARPFDLIAELCPQFIPKHSKDREDKIKKINKSQSDEQKIRGTAGAFFWESRRGYNLFSADALCDINPTFEDDEPTGRFAKGELLTETWGPYIEEFANLDPAVQSAAGGDSRNLIKAVIFTKEVDVMEALRCGRRSTRVILFNSGTQQYEEYVYNLSDAWNDMAHLGNQNTYDELDFSPAGEYKSLNVGEKISREMSFVINHETFFNKPGIADPEDDSNPENPTPTPDEYKYFAAQSSARFDLLTNSECIIKIPGNPLMCAGDRVLIHLQSKAADALTGIYDLDVESSGVYIVKELTHNYIMSEGTSGICDTTLRLMRDAYGIDTDPSSHGQ